MVNMPFLGALAGCSASRSSLTEENRSNATGSAAQNGILVFSAALISKHCLYLS
jgi:hypothetical protein